MQHGYQCGMIWGATLAAGAQVYRTFGPGPQAETKAVVAAQRLVESFRVLNKSINCFEITDLDKSSTAKTIFLFFMKGGPIGCFRMAARYAPVALGEIEAILSDESIEASPGPISCAAMVAQKMGASDLHAVMAAGFAGGIGLCGGACGALGAAIWLTAMAGSANPEGKADFKGSGVADVIGRFAGCTGGEFECSRIVGRKFASVEDHADYVCDGGCSKLIDVLAVK